MTASTASRRYCRARSGRSMAANRRKVEAPSRRAASQTWSGMLIRRSEEHTSELQSLMRNSYAVFCLKKKQGSNKTTDKNPHTNLRTEPGYRYTEEQKKR